MSGKGKRKAAEQLAPEEKKPAPEEKKSDSGKPSKKPVNNCFSSGPCAKRPGWTIDVLKNALWGRSHRSTPAKDCITKLLQKTRELLNIPKEYQVAIMPASDTGAIEAAMWNLLGERPVDVVAFDAFSREWLSDCQILGLKITAHEAPYGKIPDLSKINQDNDVVFVWNGTTSGARIPNCDWIKEDRKGLMLCDATSGIFAQDIDISKLDVVTYSFQKALGGEAGQGIMILSPRAVKRAESYVPPNRPLPKIFRFTKKGKLDEKVFEGEIINTAPMSTFFDALDAVEWGLKIGGQPAMKKRCDETLKVVSDWVEQNKDWISFLCEDPKIRSSTSITFKIVDPKFNQLKPEEQKDKLTALTKILASEKVAYDVMSYRDAPIGLRFWGGSTIEASDMAIVCEWISYAWNEIKKTF